MAFNQSPIIAVTNALLELLGPKLIDYDDLVHNVCNYSGHTLMDK